jgi:hypothetical protein
MTGVWAFRLRAGVRNPDWMAEQVRELDCMGFELGGWVQVKKLVLGSSSGRASKRLVMPRDAALKLRSNFLTAPRVFFEFRARVNGPTETGLDAYGYVATGLEAAVRSQPLHPNV